MKQYQNPRNNILGFLFFDTLGQEVNGEKDDAFYDQKMTNAVIFRFYVL